MVFDTIIARVVQDISGKMAGSINHIKQLLLDNATAIAHGVAAVVRFSVDAVEWFTKLAAVAVHFFAATKEWFNHLPADSQMVVEGITAIWVALKILRNGMLLASLTNPFTLFLAGFAAILLLFDDYEHYKKNGRKNSLFDWGGMDSFMQNVDQGLKHIAEGVRFLADEAKAAWQWWIDMWGTGDDSFGDKAGRLIELGERKAGISVREDKPGGKPGELTQSRADNAADIGKALLDNGFSRENVAGILNNLDYESGFDIASNHLDTDGKMHKGAAQWDPTRAAKFKELYGKDLTEASAYEQGTFIAWELSHTHKAAGDAIRGSHTANDSSINTTLHYEIPANAPQVAGQRAGRSQYWYDHPQSSGHRYRDPENRLNLNIGPNGAPVAHSPAASGEDNSVPEEPRPDLIPRHPVMYNYSQGEQSNVTQHNHYNISATDPHGTAREIEHLQSHNAQILIRNTRRTMV